MRMLRDLWCAAFVGLAVLLTALGGSPAHAANCAPYPYTLSNGTTADANQVMSNLNTIMTCSNSSLAHNGVNSDITQLTGISTPLSTSQGGTGQSTSIFSTNNAWTGSQTLATGTTSLAPLLFGSGGSVLTSPTVGALEWDGTNFYGTGPGPTRKALAYMGLGGVAEFREQQSSGVPSTTATIGAAFATLVLNTTSVNTITGASLASNQVTLPAGTYDVHIVIPVQWNGGTAATQCRLFNVTDTAVVKAGSNGQNAGTGTHWEMHIEGFFTLAGSKALRVECWNGQANGWMIGPAASNGTETYTVFAVFKIG